ALELGRARRRVERHDARARAQLDALLVPPPGRMDEGVLLGLAPLEVALRRRRAVVRRIELAPGEQDRAVEALLAQRGGGHRRGDAAADEQDVGVAVRHGGGTLPDARGCAERGRARYAERGRASPRGSSRSASVRSAAALAARSGARGAVAGVRSRRVARRGSGRRRSASANWASTRSRARRETIGSSYMVVVLSGLGLSGSEGGGGLSGARARSTRARRADTAGGRSPRGVRPPRGGARRRGPSPRAAGRRSSI